MKLKTAALIGLIILAGLLVAAGLAYFNRWHLAVFSFIPILATLLSVLLTLIALVFRQRLKAQTSPRRYSLNTTLLLVSLFFILQLAFFPFAQLFRDLEVQRARQRSVIHFDFSG